ncbi:hypothetical protein BTO30_14235 [Domibacillus antri]|uniref:Uncharacterized protein n=1 Tax=Domibacillus antri TaxID=1714264 RepID=A0A1Q8Q2I1_9BACI|nr:hypothetical protein [Domibacillus antri]OLN21546.1 hypothetical protein BTO30_14235 [Domibacillus antri]
MAWYSYFLLNVPEAITLIGFVFALFGISMKDHIKSILIFSLLYGAAAFTLSIWMNNSLKPVLMLILFSVLAAILFRMTFTHGFILALISFVCLTVLELVFTLLYLQIFSLQYNEILNSPWTRIAIGYGAVILPMSMISYVLYKRRVKINIPLFVKQ